MPRARTLTPHARAAALTLSLAVAGCAAGPRPTEAPWAETLRGDDSHYIVLAVTNDPGHANAPTGGTLRAYGGANDYVVSDGARRTLRAVTAQYHLRSVAAWPIALLHLQCVVFAVPADAARDAVLAQLQQDSRVALAEPLHRYELQTAGSDAHADAPVDAPGSVQASNERMEVSAAHRLATGRGVRVALVDTGLDSTHPDLRGRISSQRNFVDTDERQFQQDRHGTAVAGVIAANAGKGHGLIGVAPEAQLLALKACWQLQEGHDAARCNAFTLAKALVSAVELKAQIINLSLTGPPDPLLAALARQAMRKGIVLIGPSSAVPSFPGDVAQLLGVARSEDHDAPSGVLQAPGRDVMTLAPGGHYDFSSGSSIATGEITGIAALMLSRDATLTAANLHRLLDLASDSRDTAAGPDRSVNACQALAKLVSGANCAAHAAN